jgi:hypothetical protein
MRCIKLALETFEAKISGLGNGNGNQYFPHIPYVASKKSKMAVGGSKN